MALNFTGPGRTRQTKLGGQVTGMDGWMDGTSRKYGLLRFGSRARQGKARAGGYLRPGLAARQQVKLLLVGSHQRLAPAREKGDGRDWRLNGQEERRCSNRVCLCVATGMDWDIGRCDGEVWVGSGASSVV